jgi:clan AA aspartic protease (TIGR02281 family)
MDTSSSGAASKFLGTFGRWEAHRSISESGDPVCFISTLPAKTIGRLGKSSEAMLKIVHLPKRRPVAQVQIRVGVPLKSGVPLELVVGSKTFKLATAGDRGHAASPESNAEVVAALQDSREAKARSVPARGLKIADTYSLEGLSDALAVINKECGDGRDTTLVIPQSSDGHYYIGAAINGTEIRLMVDTGSTTSVLSIREAARAGIIVAPGDFSVTVRTASGLSKAARVQVRQMRVGEAVLENLSILVMEMPAGVSVLGLTTLERFKSYEFKRGVLTLRW